MDWSTERVELAVLGSLVSGRAPAPEAARLLRPDDFTEPWCGEVITWLRGRRLEAQLAVIGDQVPAWARADVGRLTQLFLAAGPPAYLPEYMRLLVETSTAVAGMGVVLHAARCRPRGDGDRGMLDYSLRAVRTVITDHRRRLQLLRSPEELRTIPDHGAQPGVRVHRSPNRR